MSENNKTTSTITLSVRGDGTALENTSQSTFGLVGVTADRGATVTYVPDPDNDQKTIFWVRDIQDADGVVTLTLEYAGM